MARLARRPHLQAGPRARKAARPPAYPVPAAASQDGAAARGQRQRRPSLPPAPHPTREVRSAALRPGPPSAPGSRYLLTRAARSSTTKMAAGGGPTAARGSRAGLAGEARANPTGGGGAPGCSMASRPPPPPGSPSGGGVVPGTGAGNRGWRGWGRSTPPDPILGSSADQVCKLPRMVLSRMSEPI